MSIDLLSTVSTDGNYHRSSELPTDGQFIHMKECGCTLRPGALEEDIQKHRELHLTPVKCRICDMMLLGFPASNEHYIAYHTLEGEKTRAILVANFARSNNRPINSTTKRPVVTETPVPDSETVVPEPITLVLKPASKKVKFATHESLNL